MAISARFHQEFEGLILKRSPVVWLCAADYVHRPDKALPLILADGSSIYREMALAALEQHHIRWTVTRIVPDLVGIKAAIRAGLGVTRAASTCSRPTCACWTRPTACRRCPR